MNNPLIISIEEGVVKLAATAVTTGKISKHRTDGRQLLYYSTYRLTGQAAPTYNEMKTEMTLMFQKYPEEEEISASASIDGYVIAALEDGHTEFGKLVVSV